MSVNGWWRRLKSLLGWRSTAPSSQTPNPYAISDQHQRRVAGVADLPFGRLRYVDALTANAQLQDIFVAGNYDFSFDAPAPFIIDCGGNVGVATMRFKTRFPDAEIIVFEPDPQIASTLQANIAAAGYSGVKVVVAAAWKSRGEIAFAVDGADSGRISNQEYCTLVKAERLADWIDKHVDLLKLDVEGAEYAILNDLIDCGRIELVQRIICEFHCFGTEWAAIGVLMQRLIGSGFELGVHSARSHPDLGGPEIPTPFRVLPSGKGLVQLYAWRKGQPVWKVDSKS